MVLWIGLGIELVFFGYLLARLLDRHAALADLGLDVVAWWRRMTFTGRHSRSWMRQQARAARRRQVREEAEHESALDRVWVGAIGAWADRARGQGLDRGRIAWT